MKQRNKIFIIYIIYTTVALLSLAVILGIVLEFFITVPYFDKCLHLATAAFISGIAGFWIADKAKMRPLYAALFVFSFGVTVGVFFELVEFAADSLLATNHQHWILTTADKLGFLGVLRQGSGLVDTMGDIVANTVGSAIVAAIVLLRLRKRAKNAADLAANSAK